MIASFASGASTIFGTSASVFNVVISGLSSSLSLLSATRVRFSGGREALSDASAVIECIRSVVALRSNSRVCSCRMCLSNFARSGLSQPIVMLNHFRLYTFATSANPRNVEDPSNGNWNLQEASLCQ